MRIFILLLVVVVLGCTTEIEYPQTFPLIVADSVTNVTGSGATFNAHILNQPSDEVTSYGFEWFATDNPQTTGRTEVTGKPDGKSFSVNVTRDLLNGKQSVTAFVKTATLTIKSSPVKFISLGSAPPKIVSFTPTEGVDGTEVTLTIENLTYNAATTKIYLQGFPAKILSGSDTQIKVKIPNSSLVGKYRFNIQTRGNGNTSDTDFKVLGPTITSLSKMTARVGEKIVLTGEQFGSVPMSVTFGTTYGALYKILSPTQLDVYVPDFLNNGNALFVQINSYFPNSPEKVSRLTLSFTVLNSWTRVGATTPLGTVGGYSAVTIGDLIYIVGGTSLYTFNPATKEWIKKADFPGQSRTSGSAFTVGGKLYFGFGIKGSSNTVFKDIWSYDPSNNQWAVVMDAPIAARANAAAIAIGSKVYIGLGNGPSSSGLFYSDIWAFDPGDKSWTAVNNNPLVSQPSTYTATGFAVNGKAYFMLQNKGLWEYDPATSNWTSKKNSPIANYNFDPVMSLGSSALVFGGPSPNKLYKYDASIDDWIPMQTFAGNGRSGEVGAFINGKVYYGLGSQPDFWELTLED